MPAEDSEITDSANSGVQVTKNMLDAASVEGVFSKETRSGDTVVITASEIVAAMGAGGSSSGGGGGGTAVGRPVAVISVDPTGEVTVTPIVDPTKIALAAITVLGSFLVMLGRIRRTSRELAAKVDQ
jgi:hypothetical protein